MMGRVRLRAYAKINWGLEIPGKRPDGYHEIRTITGTISLADRITLTAAPAGIELRVRGRWGVPADAGNIAWKAAEAFRERFGAPAGVVIDIDKRIPVGAGLGGGSSDCAAVLAGLARMTGVGAEEDLVPLAAALGSDTVLFLRGGAALCCGRGEIVVPIAAPREYNVVVTRPDVSVSTAEAYGLLEPGDFSDGSGMDALALALEASAGPDQLAGLLRNAFTRPVTTRCPEVADTVAALRARNITTGQMTGSGSAVFGVAADAGHARRAAGELRALGYWAHAARTVNCGHQFMEATDDE